MCHIVERVTERPSRTAELLQKMPKQNRRTGTPTITTNTSVAIAKVFQLMIIFIQIYIVYTVNATILSQIV